MKITTDKVLEYDCECCGDMSNDIVLLDGEKIYDGIIHYPEIYDYICEQCNTGVTHFDIISVEDKEYNYYTQVNGRLFNGSINWNVINEMFKKYRLTCSSHEIELDSVK